MKRTFKIQNLAAGSVNSSLIVLCAFAFSIPLFPKFLPWIAAMLSILFILTENVKFIFRKIFYLKLPLVFISVYLIYVAGIFYSENKAYGWNDLGMKISLLIFPILLAGNKLKLEINFNRLRHWFVAGCSVSALVLISRASYMYIFKNQNYFFYENFSFSMHPTYLSLYFNVAIAALLLKSKEVNKLRRFLKVLCIFLFSVTIILLSSKAGMLGLCIVFFISFIFLALSEKKPVFFLLLIIIPSAIFLTLNYFLSENQNRFKTAEHVLNENNLDKASAESSTVRLFIWKTAINIIKENLLFGVGTGDVKDELMKAYSEKGIAGAFAKKLNAHNQFLQTAISLGVTGFLVLFFSLALPLAHAFTAKNGLYAVFSVLIIFNFLFESMLERQDGIMFYAFFNSLLYYSTLKDERS